MGFGKRKVPVRPLAGHAAGDMPVGQLPLGRPATARVDPAALATAERPALADGARPEEKKAGAALPPESFAADAPRPTAGLGGEGGSLPDADSVGERLERGQAEHERRLAEINRSVAERVPGAAMLGFSLLPDACWRGPLGRFLTMRLGLFPHEDWNMIFLPADERSAEALDLPVHPGSDVPAFVAATERFLRDAESRLNAADEEAERTQDLQRLHETREDICEKLRGLARGFLDELDKDWEDRHA